MQTLAMAINEGVREWKSYTYISVYLIVLGGVINIVDSYGILLIPV